MILTCSRGLIEDPGVPDEIDASRATVVQRCFFYPQ